jgi:uncharacterized membrane protein YjjP (DUF1212 family)
MDDWLKLLIAFFVGVLASAMVKGAASSLRSKVSG